MTKHWKFLVAMAAIAWAAAPAHAESLTLASPDGRITVTVNDEGGRATYAVAHDGEQVIAEVASHRTQQLGHSVEMFYRVYSKWIAGADHGAERRRLDAFLSDGTGTQTGT